MATTAKQKTPNYTPEQDAAIEARYVASPTPDTVEELAGEFGKTTRSIIAKLSRLGVYVKKASTKTEGQASRKGELAAAIGKILGMSEQDGESLVKANKPALEAIFKALATSKPIED